MSTIKKSNKLWFILIPSILVVLTVLIVVAKKRNKKIIEVSTEMAVKRSIIETVAANGKIQPALDVKISPYISGEVVQLFVREGNYVYKGDILAKIDPTFYISSHSTEHDTLPSPD